jgi:hypothetical protein
MNVERNTYVPGLKWRQAEYQALVRLSDEAKAQIVPFFMIPPIEYDFEEGEPKKTPQEHLQTFPTRFRKKWGNRPAWIDVDLSLQDEILANGTDSTTYIFTELRGFESSAVPVVSLDCSKSAINAVSALVNHEKRGVAFRVRLEHIMLPDFDKRTDDLLKQLGTEEADVDFVVDLGTPAYEPYEIFSKALLSILAKVTILSRFRSFIILGTAFPASMQDLAVPGGMVDRQDWLFYKKLVATLPGSMRMPSFGDYTVVNPTFTANFDMRMIKPAGKVVYTTKDQWMIRKGGSFRGNPGQMHNHCSDIVRSGLFCGAGYSNGDDYIARCARREATAGPSTLTRWKEIGISHHIMHVLHDLATLCGGA